MLRDMDLLEQTAAERNLAALATDQGRAPARGRGEGRRASTSSSCSSTSSTPTSSSTARSKYVRWLWTPAGRRGRAASSSPGRSASSSIHWDEIWNGTMELYAFLRQAVLATLVQFFFILTFIGAIHEFAPRLRDARSTAARSTTSASPCCTSRPPSTATRPTRSSSRTSGTGSGSRSAGIYIEAWICSIATVVWVRLVPRHASARLRLQDDALHGRLDASSSTSTR